MNVDARIYRGVLEVVDLSDLEMVGIFSTAPPRIQNKPGDTRVNYDCFYLVGGDWNMNYCFHILRISSSQLTFMFQRGRYTTDQPVILRYSSPFAWRKVISRFFGYQRCCLTVDVVYLRPVFKRSSTNSW